MSPFTPQKATAAPWRYCIHFCRHSAHSSFIKFSPLFRLTSGCFVPEPVILRGHAMALVKLFIEMRPVIETAPVDNLLNGERGCHEQFSGKGDAVVFYEIIRREQLEVFHFPVEIPGACLEMRGKALGRQFRIIEILLYVGVEIVDKLLALQVEQFAICILISRSLAVIILPHLTPAFQKPLDNRPEIAQSEWFGNIGIRS